MKLSWRVGRFKGNALILMAAAAPRSLLRYPRRLPIHMTRFQTSFLALVCFQAAHSVEEFVGRLYDVFPPARFVSSLISTDRERGFVIINLALVTFGFWCFLWPARRQWALAVPLAWFWVAIELLNGVGHPLWSLSQLRYTPGLATAPFLLALALYVGWQLRTGIASPSAAA